MSERKTHTRPFGDTMRERFNCGLSPVIKEGILEEVNAVAVKRVKEMTDLTRGKAAAKDAIWDNENDKGWDDV